MLHGNVINHLHHDYGFTDTGAAKHPHFTASGKGYQQVDHLYAGFEHAHFGILLGE